MYFDINQEGIFLSWLKLPFWASSLIFLLIIIVLCIRPIKRAFVKIVHWIGLTLLWIWRGIEQIFFALTNKKFRSDVKATWKKWSDFYRFRINLDGDKIMQMAAFIFIVLFITIFVFCSSVLIKEIVQITFSKIYASAFALLFLLIFLYTLISCQLVKGAEQEYSPYFFSFLMISFILLPNITLFFKVISIAVVVFILLPGFYYSWKKPKWKTLITLVVMASVFLLGLLSIYAIYSEKQETINFIDCDTRQLIPNVNMSCSSAVIQGQINGKISNFLTTCDISPSVSNFTGNITYQYINGSYQTLPLAENKISFLPPDKIKGIRFIINRENYSCMDITWPVYFKSYDEYKQDKEKFIGYLFAVLALVFVTIPPMVMKFIKIWEED